MKKMMIQKKGGIDSLMPELIFLILTAVFFAILFIFVARAGINASIYEQIYSKQIALLIDQAKSGTNLSIDISKLYEIAEENKFNEKIINIDPENKEIVVKLTQGKGYKFKHFNGALITWGADKKEEKLYIQIR